MEQCLFLRQSIENALSFLSVFVLLVQRQEGCVICMKTGKLKQNKVTIDLYSSLS